MKIFAALLLLLHSVAYGQFNSTGIKYNSTTGLFFVSATAIAETTEPIKILKVGEDGNIISWSPTGVGVLGSGTILGAPRLDSISFYTLTGPDNRTWKFLQSGSVTDQVLDLKIGGQDRITNYTISGSFLKASQQFPTISGHIENATTLVVPGILTGNRSFSGMPATTDAKSLFVFDSLLLYSISGNHNGSNALTYLNAEEKSNDNSSHPIFYTGYLNRGEVIYDKENQITRFEFADHELQNKEGFVLALNKTIVSSSIDPSFSATIGNGSYVLENAIYRKDYLGSDASVWARLQAPSPQQGASLTLFTSSNVATHNNIGQFSISPGNGNLFSFSTNSGSGGTIGWENTTSTSMKLSAEVITTNAEIRSNSVIKSNSLVVYDGDWTGLTVPEGTQAYFASYMRGNSGITVENLNPGSSSVSRIILKHGNTENWIGTYSVASQSALYTPGALVLESQKGILFSDNNCDLFSGSFRFVINSVDVLSLTAYGVNFRNLTSNEIRRIQYPVEGQFVYNEDEREFCFYDGSGWRVLKSRPMD